MKKIVSILLIISILIPSQGHAEENTYRPVEKSQEELMMDLFLSLLLPHIEEAVVVYYSNTLSYAPAVYPYQIDITNMHRIGEYRSFEFEVTLEATPVVGPHISVGKDRLTYYISPSEVRLTKFQHLRTDELPPNWQDIIKKKKVL